MYIHLTVYQKWIIELGVVAHACNPSIWEAETGGSWFEDSLGYLARLSNLDPVSNKE